MGVNEPEEEQEKLQRMAGYWDNSPRTKEAK